MKDFTIGEKVLRGEALNKWYHVGLEYDPYRKTVIKVEGEYHFVGYLVAYLNDKVIFNLQDERGLVILPFENIKWMVPLYKP